MDIKVKRNPVLIRVRFRNQSYLCNLWIDLYESENYVIINHFGLRLLQELVYLNVQTSMHKITLHHCHYQIPQQIQIMQKNHTS